MKLSNESYNIIVELLSEELNNLQKGEDDLRRVAIEEALQEIDVIGTD